MSKPQTLPKQVRLPNDLEIRLQNLVENSNVNEAEIIRQAIRAGLDRLESGDYNPFVIKKSVEAVESLPPLPHKMSNKQKGVLNFSKQHSGPSL